jgi:hypothetical protein
LWEVRIGDKYQSQLKLGGALLPQLFKCAMQHIFRDVPKESERIENKLTNSVA